MHLLSIVIPVYNVQKYITKCINSILGQIKENPNVELIIVDDGSPDNSIDIIKPLIESCSNVRLISQQNKGLSEARNVGLSYSKGEYVWFIDSDDYISNDIMEGILGELDGGIDMLQLNWQTVFENNKETIINHDYNFKKGIVSGLEAFLNNLVPIQVQFTIFLLYFLIENRLRFYPGIYHEDSEFKPRAIYLAKSIKFHEPIVYNYLQRLNGSITSSFKIKNGLDTMIVAKNLKNFYQNTIRENIAQRKMRQYIALFYNSLLYGYNQLSKEEKRILYTKMKENRYIFREMIKSGHLKYVLEGVLLSLNLNMGISAYSLIKHTK